MYYVLRVETGDKTYQFTLNEEPAIIIKKVSMTDMLTFVTSDGFYFAIDIIFVISYSVEPFDGTRI